MSTPPLRNEATAAKVKQMAMTRYKPGMIAKRLKMTQEQLEDLYGREIELAGVETRILSSATLFNAAIGGDLASIAQILRTRAGWSETAHKLADKPLPEIEPIPPQTGRTISLPCNTRAGCIKGDPALHDEALKRLWEEMFNKAIAAGCEARDLAK
jgi:hypothetical protein